MGKGITNDIRQVFDVCGSTTKAIVRDLIITQCAEMMSKFKKDSYTVLTLPGMHWTFEHLFSERCSQYNIQFFGVEHNLNILKASASNMPPNSSVIFGDVLDAVAGKVDLRGFHGKTSPRKKWSRIIDIAWIDTCNYFDTTSVTRIVSDLKSRMLNGLVYFTFCNHWRGRTPIAIRLREEAKDTDSNSYVRNNIIKIIGMDPIFDIVYGGGRNQRTRMHTIGFHIGNIGDCHISPFIKDLRGNHLKSASYISSGKCDNFFKHEKRKEVHMATKSASKVKSSGEHLAKMMIGKNIDTDTIYRSLGKKYSIKKQQIAAWRAWNTMKSRV